MCRIIKTASAVFILLIVCRLPLFSQEVVDSTFTFNFRNGESGFYAAVQENGAELARMLELVGLYETEIASCKIQVEGFCNSCSTREEGLRTAKTRSNHVKSALIHRVGLKEENFVTHNHLYGDDYVTVTFIVPSRQETVVAKTEEEARIASETEVARLEAETEAARIAVEKEAAEKEVRLAAENEAARLEAEAEAARIAAAREAEATPEDAGEATSVSSQWSLRANLLRWATLTPDLGVEWHFLTKWSVLIHGTWTSWNWKTNSRRYALWEVTPEVRYQMEHLYVGAHGKVGSYNYQFDTTRGCQGDLFGGGLTVGYNLPLSSSWALDFHLGAGALHTASELYYTDNSIRVKESNSNRMYWGVTDLAVTLVWSLK